MARLCAQGDILIERVEDTPTGSEDVDAVAAGSVISGSVILAAGEKTGHHHRLHGSVALYRDDERAREIPRGLYVGHVRVSGSPARLEHEEHAPITLEPGLYRVRRQRQLDPSDVGIRERFGALDD